MDIVKTEAVFNLDELTEGKAYRITLISGDKGCSYDGLLGYKKKDTLTFCFIKPETGLPSEFKVTPYDIDHKRYKIEPLFAEADKSKSMLESAKSMRYLCEKTAACDGCAIGLSHCKEYMKVRPKYWSL